MKKIRNTQQYSLNMEDLFKDSEKLMVEVKNHLKEAEDTSYEGRDFTYSRGGPGGVIPFRLASEKAWIALAQAVDVFVNHSVSKIPKGHYARKLALREIEENNAELSEMRFYDRYAARAAHIRGNVNYYTSKDLEFLSFEIGKANELISDIKKIISK